LRLACVALFAMVVVVKAPAAPVRGAEKLAAGRATEPVRELQLRGRVVCLAEEMHGRHGAALPTNHGHLWGFRAEDGQAYTLLRGKFSEAIFLDDRLREKELSLKVRLFPKSSVIEVMTIHSVRLGVVQDLFYYCDICAIKAVSPDPCACCQGPMELVEQPLSKRDE
jgi:hypothetical protein